MRACATVCGWAWLPDVACVCASLRFFESMCLCLSPDSGNILPHVFYILKTCWASFDKSAGDLNTLHLSSMIQVSVHCKYDGTHPVFSLPVSVRFRHHQDSSWRFSSSVLCGCAAKCTRSWTVETNARYANGNSWEGGNLRMDQVGNQRAVLGTFLPSCSVEADGLFETLG